MILSAPPPEIIRLTAENPSPSRLEQYAGTAEKRSALCGSRVIVDVNIDDEDRIVEIGTRVNACAFGQAAATLMVRHVIGKNVDQLVLMREQLAKWIIEDGRKPDWPEIDHLRPDRLTTVRKSSVQLAFQAVAEAAMAARSSRP